MARTSDYNLGPHTFPRGWFMVADASQISTVPQAVRFFGQELVLYRGHSGRVYLVDAYCPHMGTHLAKNTTSYVIRDKRHVEGDSIRCPYHAWRFGADGRCNEIPYSSGRIPEAARLRTWTVQERYGCIYVWQDPEGASPDFDLPSIPEWDDPTYIRWQIDDVGVLACHPIEVLDNMADVAHLGPTHGAPSECFHNEIDGVVLRQRQAAAPRGFGVAGLHETDTFYAGPGMLLSYFNGGSAVMYVAHTPVDDGSIKVWHGLLVRTANNPPSDDDVRNARAAQAGMLAAFSQDFEIWTHKRPCLSPWAVRTDGSFAHVRTWYRQFYNERAKATDFQARCAGVHTVAGMPARKSSVLARHETFRPAQLADS